ncbi:hypothetical protein ACU635_50945 [[Actinomadura] parvosata]|uniref:hypothetical protein n=1 Tax=[Actinomadura] parvosata TaxID=1955412 RepID=UPI00406BE303
MAQLTYFVAPWDQQADDQPAWTPAPDNIHTLRHGYNLADLQQLTRFALRRVYGSNVDYRARHDVAWSAIAEALYAAPDDQPPAPSDLLDAAQKAMVRHVRDEMHHHGRDRHNSGQAMPMFASYWEGMQGRSPSPEGQVVEKTALWQIWPRLTDREREVLLALAAHENYRAAAEALGANPATFNVNVSKARKRFLALWHEGETPSRVWGTDRRTGSYTATSAPARKRRAATRAVARRTGRPRHELVHGRASTYTNHGCRCTPCTAAATDKARESRRASGAKERRRVTVSQLAAIQQRRAAGESLAAIARDLGFADSYLSRLTRGIIQPAPDPT